MMRKLLIIVLCGFVQRSASSRMRFDPAFHDPLYRHDPHMHAEPVCKREHFFPREPMRPPTEQMMSQQGVMRNEPLYGNEAMMAHPPPQPAIIPHEDYLGNEPIMQSEPIIRNDAFIRTEPVFRREAFIRREPILRREPTIRSARIYQSVRESGVFGSQPNPYTFMVSQCPCQEAQNGPQDTIFQIPQPIEPLPQPPVMAHRIIFPKPVMKSQTYQPIVTFPRFQRYVRKSFKTMPDNIQFSAPTVQNTPVQDFGSFNSEPVAFSTSFQSQGQQPENTSEPSQTNPVTARNVPQMPNPLTLAQMSSIC